MIKVSQYRIKALGGGVNLPMVLGTEVRLESPNPTPFIYTAKLKTDPFIYIP